MDISDGIDIKQPLTKLPSLFDIMQLNYMLQLPMYIS